MNLEKNFKEQLSQHRIDPSAKPWDRIEAELNKNKRSTTFVMYSRWAAAASVALFITGYSIWNKVPLSADMADTKKVEQINVPATPSAIKVVTPNENKVTEAQAIVNTIVNTTEKTTTNFVERPNNKAINPVNSTKKNSSEFNIQIINNQEVVSNNSTNNYIQKSDQNIRNTSNQNQINRPYESLAQLNAKNTNAVAVPSRKVTIGEDNLPEIPNALVESSTSYRKWSKLINEEYSEQSDSTLTEMALQAANRKTIAFVQKNWQPALKNWLQLRRGF